MCPGLAEGRVEAAFSSFPGVLCPLWDINIYLSPFIHSLIHSSCVNTGHVPGTVLGVADATTNEELKVGLEGQLYFLLSLW